MLANVQTMAYYRDVPWHGLGNRVPEGVTSEKMIRAAGMDWLVELRPARGAQPINRKGEYSRYEVIRVPRPSTSEAEVLLGVVSRRYQPLQNVDAFEFFDPIVGEKKAYFETAGVLGGGERVFRCTGDNTLAVIVLLILYQQIWFRRPSAHHLFAPDTPLHSWSCSLCIPH
jgi:hypothetical protein